MRAANLIDGLLCGSLDFRSPKNFISFLLIFFSQLKGCKTRFLDPLSAIGRKTDREILNSSFVSLKISCLIYAKR